MWLTTYNVINSTIAAKGIVKVLYVILADVLCRGAATPLDQGVFGQVRTIVLGLLTASRSVHAEFTVVVDGVIDELHAICVALREL